MSEIILHHYDMSPYAEKIRLALGRKALAWRSVQTPMVLPKPDHMELTGGYRRVPVMQIGADVYCDTHCIARELDRRYPDPPLSPPGLELQEHALSRFGETTFKLTNIDRSEPDATLFEAPAGYTVTTTPGFESHVYKQKIEKQYIETKARKKP